MSNTTLWALPIPEPYQGPERCQDCAGAKMTGVRHEFNPGETDRVLLVDVICPTCGGCGRRTHDECTPMEHADWDPDDPAGGDDYQDDEGEQACPFCHGRRWWVCQGFNDNAVHDLRVACGCAEPLMVEVPR